MNYGCQLYSCRNFQPLSALPRALAEVGYSSVEGYPDVYGDPAGFRSLLDAAGLIMPSGHFPLATLDETPGRVAEIATTLGISKIFCPYLEEDQRPSDFGGWVALARRLEAIGANMRARELTFGWHNHDFEFVALPTGEMPMAVLLAHAPSIEWEADIAWIVRSGNDPLAWIAQYEDRITAVHVKDIAPVGTNQNEDGWADVGEGIVDWPNLLPKLDDGQRLFITEHDNPSDVLRFARNSVEWLKSQEVK